jgi:hypothetical protein
MLLTGPGRTREEGGRAVPSTAGGFAHRGRLNCYESNISRIDGLLPKLLYDENVILSAAKNLAFTT